MVAEAREQIRWRRTMPRSLDLIIEVLIFTLVFFVSSVLLEGVLAVIGLIPLLLTDKDFLAAVGAAATSGQSTVDLTASMEVAERLTQSPAVIIVTLFSTVGIIVGVIIHCRAIERRRLATLGFRRGHAVREYAVGALIGFALFSLAMLICVLTGTLSYEGLALGSTGLIVLFLLGFLVQGASEEVLLRGYFMVSLARRQSLVVAVVVSSCFFGVLHLGNSNVQPLAIVNIVLFGCFAGVYLLKRGNIWGAAAIHSLWNFAQGNIYGISVSGLAPMESVFSFAPVAGGELINGGAFGIEGGLAATGVLAVALVIALLLRSNDPAPQVLPLSDGSTQVAVIPGAHPLPLGSPLPPGTQLDLSPGAMPQQPPPPGTQPQQPPPPGTMPPQPSGAMPPGAMPPPQQPPGVWLDPPPPPPGTRLDVPPPGTPPPPGTQPPQPQPQPPGPPPSGGS
jgi:membrane protease YdiL (CAAX protease family)